MASLVSLPDVLLFKIIAHHDLVKAVGQLACVSSELRAVVLTSLQGQRSLKLRESVQLEFSERVLPNLPELCTAQVY